MNKLCVSRLKKKIKKINVINPNFSSPSIGINNYNSYQYNTNSILGWTLSGSSSTGLNVSNGITPFSDTHPPQSQYTTVQFGSSPTSHTYSQSVYIPSGEYRVSFYARTRIGFGVLNLTCSLNGSSKSTTGLSDNNRWTLYSFETSIISSTNYDIVFTTTGNTDSFISFTGIVISK